MFFELTDPARIGKINNLNKLEAELRAMAKEINVLVASRDPARAYSYPFMIVAHTDLAVSQDLTPKTVTEVRVSTFLSVSKQLDLFAPERALRRYVFPLTGRPTVTLNGNGDRAVSTFSSHREALADLTQHLAEGLRTADKMIQFTATALETLHGEFTRPLDGSATNTSR